MSDTACQTCQMRYGVLELFQRIAREMGEPRVAYILAWRHGFDPLSHTLIGDKESLRSIGRTWEIEHTKLHRLEKQALKILTEKYAGELKAHLNGKGSND